MITFVNSRTGVLAEMPEAADFPNREDDVTVMSEAKLAQRAIDRMDSSKRWYRLNDTEDEAAEREEEKKATTAGISRATQRSNKRKTGDTGMGDTNP